MADEPNTHLEEATTDGGRSFADDAVSNRSDDTALDEGHAVRLRIHNGSEAAGDEGRESETERDVVGLAGDEITVDVAEAEAADTDEAAESAAFADSEVADETQAESAEEEQPTAPATVKPRREETPEPEEEIRMDWYILKVHSNRERSIAEALERKMRIEGLDRFFDQVIVPTEKVTEFKGGKKKVVERKLYPGYIVVHMHINDDTWFAVRETSGVGDFTGAGELEREKTSRKEPTRRRIQMKTF